MPGKFNAGESWIDKMPVCHTLSQMLAEWGHLSLLMANWGTIRIET